MNHEITKEEGIPITYKAIDWVKFFGYTRKARRETYYKAFVNGHRVEMRTSTHSPTIYSIGNMDHAKVKYKSEKALLDAVKGKKKEEENV